MTLPEYPLLLNKPLICKTFGISRWTLNRRIQEKKYDFDWVLDCGTIKATRESVQNQLNKMEVSL